MVIFNSYVSFPEGKPPVKPLFWDPKPRPHLEGTAGALDLQARPRARSGPRNNLRRGLERPAFFLSGAPGSLEKWL
jgi:hypothetical protein